MHCCKAWPSATPGGGQVFCRATWLGGAKTRAVILWLMRNTRERVLRNYQSLNPIYRKKKVKIWMLIPGRITWLSLGGKKVSFHQYLGTSSGKKPNK